jgi:transcriptional regulator with XRE-family HTH domain
MPDFGQMQKTPELILIGEKIRKLRTEQSYSQEDFAMEVGMDRAYYGGIERGERNVASINLIKIAATLGVEVGDLFPKVKKLIQSS